MLVPCDRPIDGQADRALPWQLTPGWQEYSCGQVTRIKARIMEQARQAFGRGFLVAEATGQLGLTARLLVNNRLHKISDGFVLMAMCPGQ
jgi:hypothetical protein